MVDEHSKPVEREESWNCFLTLVKISTKNMYQTGTPDYRQSSLVYTQGAWKEGSWVKGSHPILENRQGRSKHWKQVPQLQDER